MVPPEWLLSHQTLPESADDTALASYTTSGDATSWYPSASCMDLDLLPSILDRDEAIYATRCTGEGDGW